jgi:DNA-binding response OmpR family regulator
VKFVIFNVQERRPVPLPKVLIIAGNANSAGVLEDALRRQRIESSHLGYGVQTQTIALPELDAFALVLIDNYTASDTALVICGLVRAKFDKPILLRTYENDERYQLRAYEAGVDECVIAPVCPLLFLAKIRVWLQRAAYAEDVIVEVSESGFHLNPKTRLVVTPDGKAVNLSDQEFRLLYLFMTNPGRVLESDFLLSHVWGQHTVGEKKLLKNLVYRLRHKIDFPSSPTTHIHYIHGEGYKWESGEA